MLRIGLQMFVVLMSYASTSGRTEPYNRRSKRSQQELAPEVIVCRMNAASVMPSSVNNYQGGLYVANSEYVGQLL